MEDVSITFQETTFTFVKETPFVTHFIVGIKDTGCVRGLARWMAQCLGEKRILRMTLNGEDVELDEDAIVASLEEILEDADVEPETEARSSNGRSEGDGGADDNVPGRSSGFLLTNDTIA